MERKYESMAEIEGRYDGNWVLIDKGRPWDGREPPPDEGGYVVLHTPDRGELDRRLRSLGPGEYPFIAVLYIGRMPDEDDEVIEPAAAAAGR